MKAYGLTFMQMVRIPLIFNRRTHTMYFDLQCHTAEVFCKCLTKRKSQYGVFNHSLADLLF